MTSPVETTKGRAALPATVVAEQDPLFYTSSLLLAAAALIATGFLCMLGGAGRECRNVTRIVCRGRPAARVPHASTESTPTGATLLYRHLQACGLTDRA